MSISIAATNGGAFLALGIGFLALALVDLFLATGFKSFFCFLLLMVSFALASLTPFLTLSLLTLSSQIFCFLLAS